MLKNITRRTLTTICFYLFESQEALALAIATFCLVMLFRLALGGL